MAGHSVRLPGERGPVRTDETGPQPPCPVLVLAADLVFGQLVEAAIAGAQDRPGPVAAATAAPGGAPLWALIGQAADSATLAVSDAASDATITDAAFAGRVAAFARGLRARGVAPGHRVAVLVPPGIDLIAVVYACWRIGAVTVVADRGLGLRGLGAAVRTARVQHVIGIRPAIVAARTLRWAPGSQLISVASLDGSLLQRLDQLDSYLMELKEKEDWGS